MINASATWGIDAPFPGRSRPLAPDKRMGMNTHDLVEAVRLACQLSAQRYSVESARDIRELDLSAIEARFVQVLPLPSQPEIVTTSTNYDNSTYYIKDGVLHGARPIESSAGEKEGEPRGFKAQAQQMSPDTATPRAAGPDAQPTPRTDAAWNDDTDRLEFARGLERELGRALKRDEVNDLKKANKILCDELESMNRSLAGEIEALEEAERHTDAAVGNVQDEYERKLAAADERCAELQQRLATVEVQLKAARAVIDDMKWEPK